MDRKQVRLDYPDVPPMITVIGRRKQPIYLPAELVMGNELEPRVREMLPQIASFSPKTRFDAVQKIKDFLIPGKSVHGFCFRRPQLKKKVISGQKHK